MHPLVHPSRARTVCTGFKTYRIPTVVPPVSPVWLPVLVSSRSVEEPVPWTLVHLWARVVRWVRVFSVQVAPVRRGVTAEVPPQEVAEVRQVEDRIRTVRSLPPVGGPVPSTGSSRGSVDDLGRSRSPLTVLRIGPGLVGR